MSNHCVGKGFVSKIVISFAVSISCVLPNLQNPSFAADTAVLASARIDTSPMLNVECDIRPNNECSFLFVDDQYVRPPYGIELDASGLSINGVYLDHSAAVLSDDQKGLEYAPAPKRSSNVTSRSHDEFVTRRIHRLYRSLIEQLNLGNVAVLSGNEAPLYLNQAQEGTQLLKTLLLGDKSLIASVTIPETLVSVSDKNTWQGLVESFEPTAQFVKRASSHVAIMAAVSESNDSIAASNLFFDWIGYPLTLFSMAVVVLAFGHLLTHKPILEPAGDPSFARGDTKCIVGRSLLIFGVLSLVDLIWTIAANQSGVMRELNPLGSSIIDNPIALITFKVIATSTTILLLLRLHERSIAQAAAT